MFVGAEVRPEVVLRREWGDAPNRGSTGETGGLWRWAGGEEKGSQSVIGVDQRLLRGDIQGFVGGGTFCFCSGDGLRSPGGRGTVIRDLRGAILGSAERVRLKFLEGLVGPERTGGNRNLMKRITCEYTQR